MIRRGFGCASTYHPDELRGQDSKRRRRAACRKCYLSKVPLPKVKRQESMLGKVS